MLKERIEREVETMAAQLSLSNLQIKQTKNQNGKTVACPRFRGFCPRFR